ncbi:WecB/TagA/CpsF family glycosyltransferase [Maribacter flavus]|nr:WecB/TagA/CpsF family glycosyltransferase [Maribacter flavus]
MTLTKKNMVWEMLNGVKTAVPNSREELLDYVFENKNILVAVNAEKIHHATELSKEIINRNVGYPDGVGAVWALNRKGHKKAQKIPGCELWLDIVAKYHDSKSFFLMGGEDTVINKTVELLKTRYPNMNLVGYRNGFLKDQKEKEDLLEEIALKRPDVVFVAMGSPRQELLMEEMAKLHAAVYQGLGGSFDVFTGKVHRAPEWWIKNGLEGVYRTMKEPKKRVMRDIRVLPFFMNLILNRL